MRRGWNWFQEKAVTTHARAWLVALSFSESSFFIIPPDILLIAMLAAGAGRWIYLSLITSLSSVLGAIFGYAVGLLVFEPIAQPILALYGLEEQFAYVGTLYTEGAFWVVLTAAFTPIPYKVFVLSAGFFHVPFIPFLIASIIGRTVRYLLIAFIAHRFGPRAAELFIEEFGYATVVAVVLTTIGLAVYFDLPFYFF